eukprot:GHRR01037793.1.p1 GENE.GHRR01037793.1~~GHRR01037793.1.p1  ORF type:complete len:116 (-),score=24.61 GHRR01037793.1:346-693(-)
MHACPEPSYPCAARFSMQVGGAAAGGRSPSVWDKFAAESGKIQDGSSPATATDFYNKYKQDIQLMKTLGVKNFRWAPTREQHWPCALFGCSAVQLATPWCTTSQCLGAVIIHASC